MIDSWKGILQFSTYLIKLQDKRTPFSRRVSHAEAMRFGGTQARESKHPIIGLGVPDVFLSPLRCSVFCVIVLVRTKSQGKCHPLQVGGLWFEVSKIVCYVMCLCLNFVSVFVV